MKEVGTLKELNVKPGDVVQHTRSLKNYTVAKKFESLVHPSGVVHQYSGWDTGDFSIISRAIDTPKLWRDMTPEEKGALLLARHEGKDIENKGKYHDWIAAPPCWDDDYAYRVRPEPKVETVKTHGTWSPKGQMPKSSYVYEIEFETINGHPQWNTAKVTGK